MSENDELGRVAAKAPILKEGIYISTEVVITAITKYHKESQVLLRYVYQHQLDQESIE